MKKTMGGETRKAKKKNDRTSQMVSIRKRKRSGAIYSSRTQLPKKRDIISLGEIIQRSGLSVLNVEREDTEGTKPNSGKERKVVKRPYKA